jgi:hypothetical protein
MVFMNRSELTLVCVSRTGESVRVLKQHLEFLFGQIVFILTEKVIDTLQTAASFDLRSLLGGTMPSLRGILHMASHGCSVTMEAVPMLPMPPVDRARVLSAITSYAARDIL